MVVGKDYETGFHFSFLNDNTNNNNFPLRIAYFPSLRNDIDIEK